MAGEKKLSEGPDPDFRQIISINPSIVRGKRGIVILFCTLFGVLGVNCFAWIVPPPNIGAPSTQPLLPPGKEHLLPLSITAGVFVIGSLMTMAFISIWTTLNPPPANSKSHLIPIVVTLAAGFVLLLLSSNGHFHFNI